MSVLLGQMLQPVDQGLMGALPTVRLLLTCELGVQKCVDNSGTHILHEGLVWSELVKRTMHMDLVHICSLFIVLSDTEQSL